MNQSRCCDNRSHPPCPFAAAYLEGIAMLGVSGLVQAKLAGSALVVSLSPMPIVVTFVLLVHNDRPLSSSIAYFLGRLVRALRAHDCIYACSAITRQARRAHAALDHLADHGSGHAARRTRVRQRWLRGRTDNTPSWEDDVAGLARRSPRR